MALSDKECYNLTVSVSKALNNAETPMKAKHARAAIIGTFHTHGANLFWAIISKQPLQENRIVAWKFCHLLHKILREGHHLCCQHSLQNRVMLMELGKLWGHLNDGYGQCIKQYTKLLVTKINFHERNVRMPGNLQLRRGQLTQMAGNDINFYFQLAVEMFDYLDDILVLQSTIYSSITMYRVNSMTPTGQCRLAPLIPLIQDANQLYDFVVRIMFKLHSNLSNELLVGHRDRFRQIFAQLKKFFKQSSELQYFLNLISIPQLPDSLPNFLSQTDFGTYISPVVVVPEVEPEVVGNLVDTSETDSNTSKSIEEAQEKKFMNILRNKEEVIQNLQFENERISNNLKMTMIRSQEKFIKLDETIAALKLEISAQTQHLTKEKMEREELELKLQSFPDKELQEGEKSKLNEEKFTKLKTMYTQIRDEHINLLRQHGELTKFLSQSKKEAADAIRERDDLKNHTEETETLKQKYDEIISQKQIDSTYEIELLQEKFRKFESENKSLEVQVENLKKSSDVEIKELQSKLERINKDFEDQKEKHVISKNLSIQYSEQIAQLQQNENEIQSSLKDIQLERDKLKNKLEESERHLIDTKQKYEEDKQNEVVMYSSNIKQMQNDNLNIIKSIIRTCILTTEQLSTRSIQLDSSTFSDDPGGFELFVAQLENSLAKLNSTTDKLDNHNEFVEQIIISGHLFSFVREFLWFIRNSSLEVELFDQKLNSPIKQCTKYIIEFYRTIIIEPLDLNALSININNINSIYKDIIKIIYELNKNNKTEQISDTLESELAVMEKSIEEASKKIEQMLLQNRSKYTGVKLEVNEKILDACTILMDYIRILVQKSRLLQGEIISLGQGSASSKEFYKKNHQWTEGLISAAKNVAQCANLLVSAANKAIAGDAKHTDLIVAAQEIAASTAQLVLASRVKATPGSNNLKALADASKNVTQATGAVVGIAKTNSQILEEFQDMDLSQLTVHQAKTLEMEIQVKVIELEQALKNERVKLSSLRKRNYQTSGEN